MTHPLTDEKCEILSRQPFLDPETDVEATIHDMRAAADWQLEQVMKWLDKNLTNYTDNDYLGDCLPFYMLESDLKKAMRTQQQKEDNND